MLFNLFIKIWATPENIIGLIFNIIMIVSMCLIFTTWQEKWWKSLIPLYGTYILYEHTWKNCKWLFLVQLIFDVVSARCTAFMRKHVAVNLFHTIKTYIETQQLDIDIRVEQLLIAVILFCGSIAVAFVVTRITYVKICDSLCIANRLLKVGTFLLPQIFLLVDYVWVRKIGKDKVPS